MPQLTVQRLHLHSSVLTGSILQATYVSVVASQARLFRAVAELNTRESCEEEDLLPELLQHEKSLVAFENVIVTWDPGSSFIAWIRVVRLAKPVGRKVE